jgi:Histidine kinase-, DNA gyrase B-, and HSP90-like ATPase
MTMATRPTVEFGVRPEPHARLSIAGFDPLEEPAQDDPSIKTLLDESRKRDVLNILRSYTGTFDCFAEAIQNCLDAAEKASRARTSDYAPRIWITIDIENSRVRFVDNGVGMSLHELLYFLRPNVSFKARREFRGHKGVGATFLAYGYSHFKVQTKQGALCYAAVLRQGRQWAEDTSGSIKKPKFEEEEFDVPELRNEESGTSIEIVIGEHRDERPNLQWVGATTAEQWLTILRIKTPLGGVYLTTPPFSPIYELRIIRPNEDDSIREDRNISYFYPHEFRLVPKAKDITEIVGALAQITGDPTTRFAKLRPEYKRLDCIWEIWRKDEILDKDSPFHRALTEDRRELIERHQVSLYACFLRSQTLWREFQSNEVKLRGNFRLIGGGLQLASDYMVQGDLVPIPLTHAAGYQHFAHVVVHLKDGNPDMGRKTFQPELKELAEGLAVHAVNELRRYHNLLKPDTGAATPMPDRELYEWKKAQEAYQTKHPLSFQVGGEAISLISEPQQEQDVVALFHELVGIGVFRGLRFYATTHHERYDSLFYFDYATDAYYRYDRDVPLGISHTLELPARSAPMVLEYKYNFAALSRDIQREEKFAKDIDLVICWEDGEAYGEQFSLQPLLVADEGSLRKVYGSTHRAFIQGDNQPQFEVIILRDLLQFLEDPVAEEARQKTRYSD